MIQPVRVAFDLRQLHPLLRKGLFMFDSFGVARSNNQTLGVIWNFERCEQFGYCKILLHQFTRGYSCCGSFLVAWSNNCQTLRVIRSFERCEHSVTVKSYCINSQGAIHVWLLLVAWLHNCQTLRFIISFESANNSVTVKSYRINSQGVIHVWLLRSRFIK